MPKRVHVILAMVLLPCISLRYVSLHFTLLLLHLPLDYDSLSATLGRRSLLLRAAKGARAGARVRASIERNPFC